MLAPVRQSLAENKPLIWHRVARLPDYVYFRHDIHIAKGVGCVTCHGRVDQMPLTYRAIAADDGVLPRLPPRSGAAPAAARPHHRHGLEARATRARWATQLVKHNGIRVGRAHLLLCVPPMTRPHRVVRSCGNPARRSRQRRQARSGRASRSSSTTAGFRALARGRVSRGCSMFTSRAGANSSSSWGRRCCSPASPAAARERSDLALPYVNQPEEIIAGRAALLRHRGVVRGFCAAGARHDLCRPADQARRQSRASGHARPQRRFHAGGRAASFTIPTARKAPARRPAKHLGGIRARPYRRCARDWSRTTGRGIALPVSARHVAHAGPPARALAAICRMRACTCFEPVGIGRRQRSDAARVRARRVDLHYQLENCDVVVSLDDDLLGPGPQQVGHARAWAREPRRSEPAVRPRPSACRGKHAESDRHDCERPAALDASRMPALARRSQRNRRAGAQTAPISPRREAPWIDRRRANCKRPCRSLAADHAVAPASRGCRRWRPSINESSAMSGARSGTASRSAFSPTNADRFGDLARDIDGGLGRDARDPRFAIRPMRRRVRSISPSLFARVATAIHAGLYRDETARSANGICRLRMRWKAGAMRAPSTARRRSFSRWSRRSTACGRCIRLSPCCSARSIPRPRRRCARPGRRLRRRLRSALAAVAARRFCRRHRQPAGSQSTAHARNVALPAERRTGRRYRLPSRSVRSGTAVSPISPGCRNCRNR